MIFRKHLPRQLEINKFLESLKKKVIHDYDIPTSIKELSAEYEKSPFFKDIYKYITKGHIPSQIRGQALRKLKTECEDYLAIDDVLFRIKLPKNKSIEPSLLLVIRENYVPTILYQYHDSLLAGHQGVTRMYLRLKEKFYANNLFNSITKSMHKVVIHVIQDLLRNQVIRPTRKEFHMILDICLKYQQT